MKPQSPRMIEFHKQSPIPCPAEKLFRWHEAPGAFSKLMPPGEPVTVLHHDGHVRDGARAVLRVGHWPFRLRWELVHQDYVEGKQFCDVQIKGPFASYRHEHVMIAVDDHHSVLSDRITFSMPLGVLGNWIGKHIILPKFEKLFAFRHEVTRRDFQ